MAKVKYKKKLAEYNKSPINNIRIIYGGEIIEFNLYSEVKINEAILDREIKDQPSYYAFLAMLHKKLTTQFEELKMQRKKEAGKLYLKAKNKTHNGRPYNDDMCKAYVESHKLFINITTKCIKAKDDADMVFAAVMAFTQRKDLMQTLSSNNRKFNN